MIGSFAFKHFVYIAYDLKFIMNLYNAVYGVHHLALLPIFFSFAFYSIVKAPVVCDACKDDLCIRLLALVLTFCADSRRPAGL